MIFEAKKDNFFSILFYGLMGMLSLVSIVLFKSINSTVDWWGFTAVVAALLMLVWIWYGTEYKISNTILNIVSGPIKKNIPVRSITKIEIGKTMWIGYKLGLSKGGLIINYDKYEEVYISPVNRDEFCRVLKRIHPEIEIAKNID